MRSSGNSSWEMSLGKIKLMDFRDRELVVDISSLMAL